MAYLAGMILFTISTIVLTSALDLAINRNNLSNRALVITGMNLLVSTLITTIVFAIVGVQPIGQWALNFIKGIYV